MLRTVSASCHLLYKQLHDTLKCPPGPVLDEVNDDMTTSDKASLLIWQMTFDVWQHP